MATLNATMSLVGWTYLAAVLLARTDAATWQELLGWPAVLLPRQGDRRYIMLRGMLLWMLGVPIPIIILLWLFLD